MNKRKLYIGGLMQGTQRPGALVLAAARALGFVEYFFRRSDRSGDIFPDDQPNGVVAGSTPYRVMVLGESTAVGLGVTSHDIGMAGHLARKLARQTGNEVHWSAVHVPDNRIEHAPPLIEAIATALSTTDLVVLMFGIVDTLSLTSVNRWKESLETTLVSLRRHLPPGAQILVTYIPPMDNAGNISSLARRAAGIQARAINSATGSTVEKQPGCVAVPFPDELTRELWTPKSHQTPYLNMYMAWASAATEAVTRNPLAPR